jgi:hypothetical protein
MRQSINLDPILGRLWDRSSMISLGCPMSQLGQSRRIDRVQLTSGLTPQADIIADRRHVSKVPRGEVALFALGAPSPLFLHSTMAP